MAELSPEVYRRVLESLPTGVYLVDRDRRITLWNESAEKLTGYRRQEVIGCRVPGDISCPSLQTMQDGQPRELDVFIRHKDGKQIPVCIRAVPIRDEHGAIVGAAECLEERPVLPIATLATDVAAEVPDPHAMQTRLLAGLEDLAAGQAPFGVLKIAVDSLSRLRQRYGRHSADAVLRVTARTLAKNLGPDGMIGNGCPGSADHFTAIVGNSTAEALLKKAGLLQRLVSLEAVPWWGDRIFVTLSIGGTMVRGSDTPESLLERADRALSASLREQGNRVVVA